MTDSYLLIVLLLAFIGYFFPTLIAISRNHNNTLAISVANLLVGWTFLGWVAALGMGLHLERTEGPRMKAMFEVLTRENSQHLTLNDNAGEAPIEAMIVANDVRAIWWAVFGYAKRHGIPRRRVGYATRPLD